MAQVEIPRFDRAFFEGKERFTCIGSGALGGKASGLLRAHRILEERLDHAEFPDLSVEIPTLTVVSTEMFDAFLERNGLWETGLSGAPDDRIAMAFQRGELPIELVGDLRALIAKVHQPLAVRSSSLLEDALFRPFAGVYATKMIPNNQPDADARFRRLAEAVKFVWASVFFAGARSYIRATEHRTEDEKMAVVIQEIVGRRHEDRFYPDVSGVARSYSFYRSGHARPEDGVVNLALGLGKTIVDGGVSWSYSPAYPRAGPPFASAAAMLDETQSEFWAVHMGKPPEYDPIRETEYLVRAGLPEAEWDGTLRYVASTYDRRSDRMSPGIGADGPRVLNFAPLLDLEELPLNRLIRRLLSLCEESLGEKVEIEFAMTFGSGRDEPARFGFLQVRPLVVTAGFVDVSDAEMAAPNAVVASGSVLGNGLVEGIHDVVYVRPDRFEARLTPALAAEIAEINRGLLDEGRPYLLVGFGRWGSSDPWLGIPVAWGDICGAKAIVEASLPAMTADPSQGTHFFHNISSFEVSYFSVRHDRGRDIDWEWLARQRAVRETEHIRHVRAGSPLTVKVDGRVGRGVVLRGE